MDSYPTTDPKKQQQDPTLRFSSRVENYVRYRPGYPHAVVETLANECGVNGPCHSHML